MAPKLLSDAQCRSRTTEWIKDNSAGRAPGFDAVFYKGFRENGKVCVAILGQWNAPDRAFVSSLGVKGLIPSSIMQVGIPLVLARFRCTASFPKVLSTAFHFTLLRKSHVRFADRVGIIIVVTTADEEENGFVIDGQSIPGRRWHGIGFMPDDFVPQHPPRVNQLDCDSPRHPQLVSFLILISQIQPDRSTRFEHPRDFLKDVGECNDILCKIVFPSDLIFMLIVALLEIRRTGHHAIDRSIWDRFQLGTGITTQHAIAKVSLGSVRFVCVS